MGRKCFTQFPEEIKREQKYDLEFEYLFKR